MRGLRGESNDGRDTPRERYPSLPMFARDETMLIGSSIYP